MGRSEEIKATYSLVAVETPNFMGHGGTKKEVLMHITFPMESI
jgi:hypothetical protein